MFCKPSFTYQTCSRTDILRDTFLHCYIITKLSRKFPLQQALWSGEHWVVTLKSFIHHITCSVVQQIQSFTCAVWEAQVPEDCFCSIPLFLCQLITQCLAIAFSRMCKHQQLLLPALKASLACFLQVKTFWPLGLQKGSLAVHLPREVHEG